MNLVLIAVALVVVSASLISTRVNFFSKSEINENAESEVLSEESPTETPVVTSQPTSNTPTPTQTQGPTNAPVNNTNTSGWIYPGSATVSQGSTLVLESSDSTDQITSWYKSKVESEGFNVRSSVKTSANDNIKNVISAAKNNTNVSIEITKGPSDSKARIEVEASSL